MGPEAWPDIKNLIPILKDFQSKFNITLVNHEPTRYRHGQRQSLLDLILTTNPQNITDIVNVPNFCSEHMGVLCKIRIEQIILEEQFRKIRNRWNLNASILMPMIESNEKLQSIFTTSDPDTVADTLTNKMNAII